VRLNARLTKTRGSGEAGADDSVRAAGAALGRLRQLVAQLLRTANTTDAAREWSPPLATPDELDRARIAIEGIRRALMEYAAASAPVRTARLTRLSESLLPVLRDLILKVLADEYAAPGTAGQDSLAAAQQRTAHLLADWTQLVQASGVTARPKFATSHVDEVSYSVDSDVAAIREAPRGDVAVVRAGGRDRPRRHRDAAVDPVRAAAEQGSPGGLATVAGDGVDLIRIARGSAPPRPAAPRDHLRGLR